MAWPNPRFTVSGDCVTDNLTGLMWAKNANLPNGTRTWQGALDYVASMNSGSGLCGYHDWRLPNRKELLSLIDYSQYNPALPLNHPFINVQSGLLLVVVVRCEGPSSAWIVSMCMAMSTTWDKGSNNSFGQGVADRVNHWVHWTISNFRPFLPFNPAWSPS